MCGIFSRRGLMLGAIAAAASRPVSGASPDTAKALPCGCSDDEFTNRHRTRSSSSGDDKFDAALIDELKVIVQVFPDINPGFQFVDARNAFTTTERTYPGTEGTVWIGKSFVLRLKDQSFDGGIAVAGVLAHECTHVYQLAHASLLQELLKGQTNGVLAELHADFMSGYYLALKRNVMPESLATVQRVFIYPGAYNRADPLYHGSPGLRGAALDTGYFVGKDGRTFAEASIIGARYVRDLV